MSKTIKIQLRPLDYYFFGGEETFSSGAKGVVNYHVKSNRLPQQTGLLGLLRHAFFEAGYAIGNSFNGQHTDYGLIKSLSPLFLTNNKDQTLLPAPACINHNGENIQLQFSNKAKSFLNGSWRNDVVEAPAYKAKKGTGHYWLNIQTGELVVEDDIFLTKDHIGINKAKRMEQQTDEDAFYKQQFITLQAGYQFAFYVEAEPAAEIKKLPFQLPFGGEKRTFHISYTDAKDKAWISLQDEATGVFQPFSNGQPCIMLLSDAFVTDIDKFNGLLSFAIMDEQPFRNLITPAATKNFGSYTRNPGADTDKMYKRKEAVFMIKKGSVLYAQPEKLQEVENIFKQPVYSGIGYNQYLKY